MPRVLHLYKDIFPPVYGGIEVVLGKLAARQARKGWEVSAAVSGPVDRAWGERKGVRVIDVGEWGRLLSNPITSGFLTVLGNEEYDFLHLHLPCPTAVLSTLLAGRRDVPWFASYQSDIVRQRITGAIYSPFQRRFLSRCSTVFVSSPPFLESSPVLGRSKIRAKIVPLGISPEDLTAEDRLRGADIRSDYGGRRIVLFVGRFRWYKGLEVLIDAMDAVDAVLLIAGSGTPARERALRGRAESMKRPDRVRFLGTVRGLGPLFAAADLVCLPSSHRAEAFGYVLLEAFRAGVPAVTTELGTGTSYVNLDGETGFVVPPSDPPALAAAIRRIVEDPTLRESFSEAARRRVLNEFGLDAMVDSILEAYEEAARPA